MLFFNKDFRFAVKIFEQQYRDLLKRDLSFFIIIILCRIFLFLLVLVIILFILVFVPVPV